MTKTRAMSETQIKNKEVERLRSKIEDLEANVEELKDHLEASGKFANQLKSALQEMTEKNEKTHQKKPGM